MSAAITTPEVELVDGYVTRSEAMERFGVTKATLERRVQKQALRSKLVRRKGRRPERLYLAEDLDKEKLAKQEKKAARPPANALAPRVNERAEMLEAMRRLVAAFEAKLAAPPQLLLPPPAASEKLWLTLDEAVEYSGLARADLLRLCRQADEQILMGVTPALHVRKSPGWKIQRKSLEAFKG